MKKKSDKQIIRNLKKEIRDLNEQLSTVKCDRDRYRSWCTNKFRSFVDMSAEGNVPKMTWLVKDMAELFSKSEKFWWPS